MMVSQWLDCKGSQFLVGDVLLFLLGLAIDDSFLMRIVPLASVTDNAACN